MALWKGKCKRSLTTLGEKYTLVSMNFAEMVHV